MDDATLTLTSNSPEDTAAWAGAMANFAKPSRVICLWGDVGAGKTFFARTLIQTLQSRHGICEDVPSPTFTLVQTYDAADLEIWHADLYRLSGPSDIDELGLLSAFDTAFCMIEWPDRLGKLTPESALHMTFSHTNSEHIRLCNITGKDPTLLSECADHLKAFVNV